MRVALDLSSAPGAKLEGTLWYDGDETPVPFSSSLELLWLLTDGVDEQDPGPDGDR